MFRDFRVLSAMNKTIKKIWNLAISRKYIKEDEEEEDEDEESKKSDKEGNPRTKFRYTQMAVEEEVVEDSDEEGGKVPTVKGPILYDCRFFNYKKKAPSDYNYIKTKSFYFIINILIF